MANREGMTTLAVTPADEGCPVVDAIFIHGINSSAESNWVKDGHEWIVDDLPQDVKGARIMTFGYNSKVLSDATFGRIRDFAKQLLEAILADRGTTSESPIIYICHSMGGLVLKQAMVLARNDKRYSSIHQCSFGIIFLATPHRGSGKAGLAEIIVNIIKVSLTRPKTELLEQLKKDNQNLKDLSNDFRTQHSHFKIASCFELKDTDIGIFSPKLRIVSPESAMMDIEGEIQLPINADHRQICKFASSGEAAYKSIMAIIKEFVAEAPATINGRLQGNRRERILRMMKAIAPDGFQIPSSRLAELAYMRIQGTCEWILNTSVVQQFLSDSDETRLLCCYGKAGSGKTYMSSKLIQELRDRYSSSDNGEGVSVIYFFCSKNSNEPQWDSIKSILTSLLCQVLLSNLDQQEFVPIVQRIIPELRETSSKTENINVKQVEKALRGVISRLRRCWLVIDAVEESDDPFSLMNTVSELLTHDSGLNGENGNPLKALIFAREEYELGITFEAKKDHLYVTPAMISQDIDLYIDMQIQLFITRVPKRLREEEFVTVLRTVLTQKAEGMFLWVKMMVADLIEQAEERTEDFIECLRNAPSGLNEIYEQYCERLATRLKRNGFQGTSQLRRAQRCLKWLCATHVLELGQIGMILSCQPPKEVFELHENFLDGVEGPIRKCLGSLIEIRTVERSSLDQFDESEHEVLGTIQVVSLIHDSLRLFLLKWLGNSGSNVTLLTFTLEEAYLEVAISCLSYLTSKDQARQYSSMDYDPKDIEKRLLLFAGRAWLEFASLSGGCGATSIKLLKLVSLFLVTSCEIALSTLDGMPYELPRVALESSDFLSKMDIRNFADCIFKLVNAIAKEIPKLPEAEQRVVQLSKHLNDPKILHFKCQAEHILEGRRILNSMRAQGIPLKYYDLISMFNLKESSSKLQIPIRACEYGWKEIQVKFPGVDDIAPHVKYFKAISDPLHLCAVESNQYSIVEDFHSRFILPSLTATYRTAELFMGLAALRNIPSSAFHDWELCRRPRRDGYNMKYGDLAYDSVPRKPTVLNGDFLIKSLSHSGRLPSEAVAYFERFPFPFVSLTIYGILGPVYATVAIFCAATAAWAFILMNGDATRAVASIIATLPGRLFPLDPSAGKLQRILISTLLTSTKRLIPALSWMDLLRVLLAAESLRQYHRRLQIAWQVEDLRFYPTVHPISPEISTPGVDPPALSVLPPLAMQSFTARFQRLIEPCLVLLSTHLLGAWLLQFYLYLGLYRAGYALAVEGRTVYHSLSRAWISALVIVTHAVTQVLALPESQQSILYTSLLFLCFMAYDLFNADRNIPNIFRGNMAYLLAAIGVAGDCFFLNGSLNLYQLIYTSSMLIFAIDFLQRIILDPSGMLEAVSSLFTGSYLVNITNAKAALLVQKDRLRRELKELFQDDG